MYVFKSLKHLAASNELKKVYSFIGANGVEKQIEKENKTKT